ncbi:transmembrane protein, putative [Medicago truncatula]|uniref:Transmembrane protein, putative n=1 Tax=Medicago truncatula TaxID=3880 RepID=G7KKT3_MEDTR|nr:transmembrane protein, putative [Medicago truncatula]
MYFSINLDKNQIFFRTKLKLNKVYLLFFFFFLRDQSIFTIKSYFPLPHIRRHKIRNECSAKI